jgi:adenylate kinase family enzyme
MNFKRSKKLSSMILIGLTGVKGAGKDTLADFLVDQYGFHKMAFADPLREACKVIFLLSDEQLHDRVLKETIDERWNLSPRQIMQRLGTECIRNLFDPDHWVHLMRARIVEKNYPRIVVSDVRFPNEASMIKAFPKSLLVRVVRPCNTTDDDKENAEKHCSEQGSFEVDHTLTNDASVFHLRVQMSQLM